MRSVALVLTLLAGCVPLDRYSPVVQRTETYCAVPDVRPRPGESAARDIGWDRVEVCAGPSCWVEGVDQYRAERAVCLRWATRVVALERPSSVVVPARGGPVRVRGYHRRDGTYVRPHTRRRPRR